MKIKITISLLVSASFLLITNVSNAQGFSVSGTNTYTNPLANLVGIGTSTPLGTLDVLSAINAPSWTYFRGNVNATKPSTTFTGGGLGIGFNYEGNCELNFVTGPADCGTSGGYRFQDWAYNGSGAITNLVTILSSGYGGKVGIGTTTPTNILSFGNAAARKIWIENTASGTAGRDLTVAAGSTVGGTNINGGNNIIQAGLGTGSGASTISFQNGTALGSGTTLQTMSEKMTILGNGNVGIGTTTPLEKLEIYNGNILLSDNYAISWGLQSIPRGSITTFSGTPYRGLRYFTRGQASGWYGVHDFYTQVGTGADVFTMRIIDSKVGIGTTSPGVKLDVIGATHSFNTGAADQATFGGSGNTTNSYVYINTAASYQSALAFQSAGTTQSTIYKPASSNDLRFYNIGAGDVMTITQGGRVGIGTTTPSYKLEVNGTLFVNGAATCLTNQWSDSRIKTNIDSLHNALTTIHQLKPKSFFFDTANVYGLNFSSQKQYGFIAQDVETILPELISSTTKNADVDTLGNIIHPKATYKTLNYNAFIGILTKGIQELGDEIHSLKTKTNNQDSVSTALQNAQQRSIDSLRTKTAAQDSTNFLLQNSLNQLMAKTNYQDSINTSLQDQLNQLLNCCNNHGNNGNHGNNLMPSDTNNFGQNNRSMNVNDGVLQGGTTHTDVELSNKNIVVLNQNVPNPFAEQTTINYYLPDDFTRAQIIFLEPSGKIIKTVDLTDKGKGQLNVFANDLTSGIYTYSLIVDGQVIETKKMIKAK